MPEPRYLLCRISISILCLWPAAMPTVYKLPVYANVFTWPFLALLQCEQGLALHARVKTVLAISQAMKMAKYLSEDRLQQPNKAN